MAEKGRYSYEGLARLMHERARLSILTALAANPEGVLFPELLAERQDIVDDLCALKADAGRTVRDPEREAELLAHVRSVADETGLSPDLAETLFEEILAHSVKRQRRQRTNGPAVSANGHAASGSDGSDSSDARR